MVVVDYNDDDEEEEEEKEEEEKDLVLLMKLGFRHDFLFFVLMGLAFRFLLRAMLVLLSLLLFSDFDLADLDLMRCIAFSDIDIDYCSICIRWEGLAFGVFSPFPNFPHRARKEHPRSSISLVDHW